MRHDLLAPPTGYGELHVASKEELGRSGYDYAVEFEVGLDLLLDGIDQLRPQWRAAAS
jgi:hypothetical protein